jgi:hypothetical protein
VVIDSSCVTLDSNIRDEGRHIIYLFIIFKYIKCISFFLVWKGIGTKFVLDGGALFHRVLWKKGETF